MALNGTYKVSMDSPMGKQEAVLKLEAQGDALKGAVTAMGNTLDFDNGKTDGDAFEFTVKFKSPMGSMDIAISGKAEGDKITGRFKMPPFGESAFEGVKTA